MKSNVLSFLLAGSLFASLVPSALASGEGFSDVASNSPYTPYIQDLQQRGVLVGKGDGTFGPKDLLTRAEFATMLSQAFHISPSNHPAKFADSCNHWGGPYIQGGVETGIVSGTSETTFSPDDQVLQEEAYALVWRFLSRRGNPDSKKKPEHESKLGKVDAWAKKSVLEVLGYGLYAEDPSDPNYAFNPKTPMTRQQAAVLLDLILKKFPAETQGPIVIANPTNSKDAMIDNEDGTKSPGNIYMPPGSVMNQTEDQMKYNLQLLGQIKLVFEGDKVTITVPPTNSENTLWWIQTPHGHVWHGNEGKTVTCTGSTAVVLGDFFTRGKAFGDLALVYTDGNWEYRIDGKRVAAD